MGQQKFKIFIILPLFIYCGIKTLVAQNVTITVDASQDKKAVSPYLYGRNNTFDKPVQFYKDAGLRFARMNGGNNATKYNWRKKITSHPDWYNNVYPADWDAAAGSIADNHPGMQGMFAFQLLGRVASGSNHNFNDWGFNQSQYWQGVGQNLCGGGVPNTANPAQGALTEGNTNLYTEVWPADSTVEILNHWFGPGGIGLNKNQFLYWNMDNEADIWDGTHDDVMPDGLLPASEFMDKYIDVAKKARALFPEIKICGPVTTSEWQWYKWGNENIMITGKYYSWLEYFIKRCADEEKATGIRVLDVVDLHNYPYYPSDQEALQVHSIYYDENYVYPGANGLKTINGGWDNSLTKEYIFKRINDWLNQYYGLNHNIKLGLSEWSPGPSDPNLASVIYATHLGVFASNSVEYFTPWTWFPGMWETLHLYSRYAKNYSVSSTSSLENIVSAYSTVNESADSMTVIIVNRDMSSSRDVTVNLNNFTIPGGSFTTLQLETLPASETFISHTNNALKTSSVLVISNSFSITVPKLSTTAVILKPPSSTGIENPENQSDEFKIFPNPANDNLNVSIASEIAESTQITVFDQSGRKILTEVREYDGHSPFTVNLSSLSGGIYLLSVKNSHCNSVKSFVVIR